LLLVVWRLRAVDFRWDPLEVDPPREPVLEVGPLLLPLLLRPERLDERELRVFVWAI
jgi:hypothetical protein